MHQSPKRKFWQSSLIAGQSQGRSLRSLDFPALCQSVVRLWTPVRRYPGRCPEFPGWPESPASGPRSLRSVYLEPLKTQVWCGTGWCTGGKPEGPQSLRLGRSLRPQGGPKSQVWPEDSKLPELGGVSGLHRSLRPTYTGVWCPSEVQQADFSEGYYYPSTYLQLASSTSIYEP